MRIRIGNGTREVAIGPEEGGNGGNGGGQGYFRLYKVTATVRRAIAHRSEDAKALYKDGKHNSPKVHLPNSC